MPDASGNFRGISVSRVPWHEHGEVDDDTRARWRIEDDQLAESATDPGGSLPVIAPTPGSV